MARAIFDSLKIECRKKLARTSAVYIKRQPVFRIAHKLTRIDGSVNSVR
ncbi:hypothetical protein [Candidatus Methylobacter favarea]|nr:hypothetical protein [Candidatus Methylobacter favarea]